MLHCGTWRLSACIADDHHRQSAEEVTVGCRRSKELSYRPVPSFTFTSEVVSGLLHNNLSSICSQTVWCHGCNQLIGVSTDLRLHFYRFCLTFIALLSVNTSHCSVFFIRAPHSTVLTVKFLFDVCNGRLAHQSFSSSMDWVVPSWQYAASFACRCLTGIIHSFSLGICPWPVTVLRCWAYQLTRRCHLRSVPVNLPAPFEDILIPLLLQCCLILLVLTLTIVVLVVALLLRPL